MEVTKEQLLQGIENAKKDGNEEAVQELTSLYESNFGDTLEKSSFSFGMPTTSKVMFLSLGTILKVNSSPLSSL